MEQIVGSAPGLPLLDAPVPLMVKQLMDVFQYFDAVSAVVAEQEIERAQDLF